MKSSVRSMITFAAIGLASAVSGNAAALAAPAPAPAPGSTPAMPAAPALPTAHEFVQMIGEALSEVDLDANQEATVEDLSSTVEPLQRDVDAAENDLMRALADQVRNGYVDGDDLADYIDRYVTAREDLSGPLRSALETLHDILDSQQRADFADALECRIHDALRGTVSDQVLDAFADQLGLDNVQRMDLRDAFQPIRDMIEQERSDVHDAIEGFRGEVFSVGTYMPAQDVASKARRRAEAIIAATAALVDMLTPDQRNTLAARITAAAGVDQQPSGGEHIGTATQAIWAGARGPRGGAVVVGTGPRANPYPYAGAWGVGW